jgi:hypothetical protein
MLRLLVVKQKVDNHSKHIIMCSCKHSQVKSVCGQHVVSQCNLHICNQSFSNQVGKTSFTKTFFDGPPLGLTCKPYDPTKKIQLSSWAKTFDDI